MKIGVTHNRACTFPVIPEPEWCKGQIETIDGSSLTQLPDRPFKNHRLVYRWSCRRLESVYDDDQGGDGLIPLKEQTDVEQ